MSYKKVLSAHQMSEDFYDLFFDAQKRMPLREYLDYSYCDGMGEIDFNEDNFKIIYYVEGKYYNPPFFSGSFSDFYPFVVNNAVHPDDREIYMNLMKPFSMPLKFKTKNNKTVKLHMRGDVVDSDIYDVKSILTFRLLND